MKSIQPKRHTMKLIMGVHSQIEVEATSLDDGLAHLNNSPTIICTTPKSKVKSHTRS